jgi:hypothetical protein
MIKTILASTALVLALSTVSFASAPTNDILLEKITKSSTADMEAKRRKPRVPGGSGCDDPRDIAEHPECTPAANIKTFDVNDLVQEAKRRKPRVPGGSGCDDPGDVAEHPECRV